MANLTQVFLLRGYGGRVSFVGKVSRGLQYGREAFVVGQPPMCTVGCVEELAQLGSYCDWMYVSGRVSVSLQVPQKRIGEVSRVTADEGIHTLAFRTLPAFA